MEHTQSENNTLSVDFAGRIMGELAAYPYLLIKEYPRLGLAEKDVLLLLRILHIYFSKGRLTIAAVSEEFAVNSQEAEVLLAPFCDRGLIKEEKNGSYSCNAIWDCFYEDWIAEQRRPGPEKKAAVRKMGQKERDLIHALSRLFHSFEQELGKNLTPIQSEEIRSWLEQDKLPPDMIEEALRRAVLQDKRSFAYIKSILNKWHAAGFRSLQQVMEEDHKPQTERNKGRGSRSSGPAEKKSKYSDIYEKY